MGQMRSYGAQAQGALNLPDAPFEKEAVQRVKLGLIMNAIIENHGLTADEVKLTERLEQLAAGYEDAAEVIRYYRSNQTELRQIELSVIEDQAIELVLGQATSEELPAVYADVMADKVLPKIDNQDDAVLDHAHDHDHGQDGHVHDENCNH